MRKFVKDAKGAVTVFVTLLLIPAILVSGTAVDLARLHTARSILQDSNQLAANSVLTQYDALLYDLYGLMGVAKDDPILGDLLDEYIRAAVFGEESRDKGLGTFQIFYGSDLSVDEINFAENKNLRNTDVLRRQIEEYMKFRGPVLIVKQFLEIFKDNKVKEDVDTIDKKLGIDSQIAELYAKYKELYDAIISADKLDQVNGGIAGGTVGTVSSRLSTAIRDEFVNLRACYASWAGLKDRLSEEPGDTEESEAAIAAIEEDIRDCEAKYAAILGNIRIQIIGGSSGANWRSGRWTTFTNTQGLNQTVENAKKYADDNGKPKFDAVVEIAKEIDSMNGEISRKIDQLEQRLNDGQCSDELKTSLTEKTGSPPMTLIERYRDILKWNDITSMAEVFKKGGYSYIDTVLKPLLDGAKYRDSANEAAGSLTRAQMEAIQSNSKFRLSASIAPVDSAVGYFSGIPKANLTYGMPPGFLKFAEHPGKNRAFFEALTEMVNSPPLDPVKIFEGQKDESGKDAKEKQDNIIKALLKLVENAYTGLKNEPLGAKYINDSATASLGNLGIMDIAGLLSQAGKEKAMDVIYDPLGCIGKAGDYLLLLTYSTSMFSNYTTTRPESVGKSKDDLNEVKFTKSITNVPISPKVNYFFQSEWEYLYSEHQNADENLNAITRLLFLVRLICDYITVFSVKEVTTIITSIQTAFSWCPPLGVVLGELARAAFAAAEALIDVSELRTGHSVPLIKNAAKGEWVCTPKGVLEAVKKITAESIAGKEKDGTESGGNQGSDENGEKKEKGLSYDNYMHIFFLAKALFNDGAADELAKRTGDLIEWNIVNYKSGASSDEEKMAEAMEKDNRWKLIDMKTDFDITTHATMRMLFLSMPFAQRGAGGAAPPASIPLTVTDYRGY